MKIKQTELPASHVPYTDKYFLRTNEILKKEEINPIISMKVFCRGKGPVTGLNEAVEVLTKYSDLEPVGGKTWLTHKKNFANNEPLMVINGPAQSFVELETMYLGVLSHAISTAVGLEAPGPKQYFDAARLDSDISLPGDEIAGVPQQNYNVYSLLKKKFPSERYDLVFINTGVVEGICRLHTSIGLRQMFPFDRIINISDATTPLYGVGLGYKTAEESRHASTRVCRDIGIEYMTTEECHGEFSESVGQKVGRVEG